MEIRNITPPDNGDQNAKFYIIPIELFDAKGFQWTRTLTFTLSTVVVALREKETFASVSFWDKPKYEIRRGNKTGSFALDGSGWVDCMCDNCISGRKEVEAGWMPT